MHPKLYELWVLCACVARTTIEIDESTRDQLRQYKARHGLTYDGALLKLFDDADVPRIQTDQ